MQNEDKRELIKEMMDIEYHPEITLSTIEDNNRKIPFSELANIGVASVPLTQLKDYVFRHGQSGIYKVDTHGKTMFNFKGKKTFLGSLKNSNGTVGGGQAELTQMPFDPTMICVAVMMRSFAKKIDDIQQVQKQILEFLTLREESKMMGNINVLTEISNNYKYNLDNSSFKNNKHILVQDIKRDAEQSIVLYQELINKTIKKKFSIHRDGYVDSYIEKINSLLNNYQTALYMFSFSSFLETILLENYTKNYIDSIINKLHDYKEKFVSYIGEVNVKIEKESKSSIQSMALKGISKVSDGTGKIVEKIPLINKSKLDKNLTNTSTNFSLKNETKTKNTISKVMSSDTDYSKMFVENLTIINELYNETVEIYFDKENIYVNNK